MDGCPDPPGNGNFSSPQQLQQLNFSSPQQLQQLSQQPRDYGDVIDRHSLACVCVDWSEVAYETRAFEGVRFFIEHTVQHKLGPQPAFWHLPVCVCDSLFDEVPSRFPSRVSLRHQPVNARHCSFAIVVDQRRHQQVFHLPSSTSQLSFLFFRISSFMFRVPHMTCMIGRAVQHKLGPQPAIWQSPACVSGGLFEKACTVFFIVHPSFYIFISSVPSCFIFHTRHSFSHLPSNTGLVLKPPFGTHQLVSNPPFGTHLRVSAAACSKRCLLWTTSCSLHVAKFYDAP